MVKITWEEIKEKSNILDYISQFVDLEYRNGEYWGMSCFKEEDTPSFSVNEEKQLWKDFSSGKGGNIINFVMEFHKCNFVQSLKILKEFFDISGEIEYVDPPEIIKILKKFKPRNKNSKSFTRTFLPNNIMDRYNKIPIYLWEKEGISSEEIERWNVRFNEEDGCIVFPIWDNYGNLINIKARDTDQSHATKYFYYYKLGTLDFLYGYYQFKEVNDKYSEVILVEGEKSVLKFASWGIQNVMALCNGCLTDEQLKSLISLGKNVVIALDEDKDPRKDENFNKLKSFCKVNYIWNKNNVLKQKESPCDNGLDIWNFLYENRRRL